VAGTACDRHGRTEVGADGSGLFFCNGGLWQQTALTGRQWNFIYGITATQAVGQDCRDGAVVSRDQTGRFVVCRNGSWSPQFVDIVSEGLVFPDTVVWRPRELAVSDTVTVKGIDIPVNASVTGVAGNPEISVDGGAWAASGMVTAGSQLRVRMEGGAIDEVRQALVNVGGVLSLWTVTVRDGVPDAFVIPDSLALPGQLIRSLPATITGVSAPVGIALSGVIGAQVSVNGGAWADTGQVSNGQVVAFRLPASADGSERVLKIVVGDGTPVQWTVRSGCQNGRATFASIASVQVLRAPFGCVSGHAGLWGAGGGWGGSAAGYVGGSGMGGWYVGGTLTFGVDGLIGVIVGKGGESGYSFSSVPPPATFGGGGRGGRGMVGHNQYGSTVYLYGGAGGGRSEVTVNGVVAATAGGGGGGTSGYAVNPDITMGDHNTVIADWGGAAGASASGFGGSGQANGVDGSDGSSGGGGGGGGADGGTVGRGGQAFAGGLTAPVITAPSGTLPGNVSDPLRGQAGLAGADGVMVLQWPRAGVSVRLPTEIVATDSGRVWGDGTYGASCEDYRYPGSGRAYLGAVGSGTYTIAPPGEAPRDVFCNMP